MEIVAEVGNGEDVVSITLRQRPDLMLLALEIGGPGGFKVLEQLYSARLGTRVIAISRNSRQEDWVRAVRLGCQGVLPENTGAELTLKCLRKVYEGELWLDRATTAEVMRQLTVEVPPLPRPRERELKTAPLSRREREIVALVTRGLKNKELAEKLAISEQTVKNHMHNIFDKLGVSDRLELALYAIHNGLHEG